MPDWINKHKIFIAVVIFILSALFYSAGLNNSLNFFEDGAIYIMMARYLMPVHFVDNIDPRINGFVNNYPQAYPFMLSPLTYLSPNNYLVLRLLTYSFSLIFILFIMFSYKAFFKDELAALVIPLIALCPQVAYYSAEILSEIPYVLFSTLAIYFIQKYARKSTSKRILYLILGCAAVFITYNIRQIGMTIVISIPVLFLVRKEFRRGVIFTLIAIIVLISWVYFNIFVHKLPYVTEFAMRTGTIADFVHRWLYNLIATVGKEFPDLYFYPFLFTIDPYYRIFIVKFLIGCFLFILMIIGFRQKIKKEGIDLIDIYSVIYFFVFYLSWTHHGSRYCVPILLFITYYLIMGLKKIITQKKVFYIMFLILLIFNIAGDIHWFVTKRVTPFDRIEESFMAAGDWIKKNTSPNDIILSRRPCWLFVYSEGRQSVRLLRNKDINIQYKYIIDNNINYVIIDQALIYRDNAKDYLMPLMNSRKDNFEKVYESAQEPKTYIYKVRGIT